ncbi:TnpV protein [Kocuria sp. HSID16901]|uniref:TnpV protein n=1 Tax=Kocuria sp. HSID16901 TaxID=2419505 RepID=UPI000F8727FC|nr:TnpV protein [Kocuria sp. HSID16901]RUQ19843.1 TnpV protein [Kocuria sp. HSID16901]
MSDYAAIAKTNWKRLTPSQYEALEHPEVFFQNLADQAEEQINQMQLSLQGQDSPREDFLAKWGRLNAAKQQAEEIVISEVLTPPRDQWETDLETEEDESPDPTWTAINQRIAQLDQEATEAPE